MKTRLSSPTQELFIGADYPFVIIGERINPTGRKKMAAALVAGDLSQVVSDAQAQVAAGAQMLDVNAGIPMVDEPALLAEMIELVQATVPVPLSIDSSVVAALAAGLKAYQGKALVNSVTGEDERLEAVLPLVAEHGAAVIGIANDQSGISHDPEVRFAVAKKIIERAESFGIPREDVIIDPLAMPVGAVPGSGRTLFQITRRIREELGVNTTCGASNISFGLPNREGLNASFITMAITAGMTCAILNPLNPQTVNAIRAANLLMGNDENAQAWIHFNRPQTEEMSAEGAGARAARPRRPRPGSE